ncbi:unnamed protein product [Bubo scandiacus]
MGSSGDAGGGGEFWGGPSRARGGAAPALNPHYLPAGPLAPPARLLLPLICWALASRCTGESVSVWCEAASGLPELTLLYWLGNGSFIEKLHPDGAVSEGTVLEEPQGSGVTLRRDLHFSSFGARHLHTNFTCVVLSPLGVDTQEVQWQTPTPTPAQSGGLG